ncbi:chondroitin sulfate synthase 2 [Diachasma alloeum]|uniref:chondroitin sulfate synthase 2 n=1 Tax=Diachasma alloeum TaxID=454923 RepID=UPI0007383162|nr:chondroitin sulfate synthase 2 [Diachasma alloeum]
MSKLVKMTLSSCRGNGYLMIGVCLGLSLSLFMSPVEISEGIDANSPSDEFWSPVPSQDPVDEYVPKINLAQKPKIPQKVPKSLIRPRYYSTELGIREKLFIAVSTSREHLHTRGIALNKTLAHLVDKIRYFITIPEGSKPNVSLPGIVGFTDTRDILKPFHIIKYITDNYLEEYDFYFIVKDSSYVNGRSLNHLLDKISVSRDVYLGRPLDDDPNYCSLDSGIILSNSIIQKMKTNLDWCVKNTFSSIDDINFGRCVEHSTNLQCRNTSEDVQFISNDFDKIPDQKLNNFAEKNYFFGDRLGIVKNSVTVASIFDHSMVYKLHIESAIDRIREIELVIKDIEEDYEEIANFSKNFSGRAWPIGTSGPSRPSARFDLTPWDYFNESHVFMETDHENSRPLIGSFKREVEEVLGLLGETVRKRKGGLRVQRVVNGWRRFDAARGVDYILDVHVLDATGGMATKRFEVTKPLGKAEILSVPYVTENSRVNLVVIVDTQGIHEAGVFIEDYVKVCMEKRDKTSLMLVLLYDPESPSKGSQDVFAGVKRKAVGVTERFKKEGMRISWLSVRMDVRTEKVRMDPIVRVGVLDLVSRKFSPESLVMVMEMGAGLKPDFLNRVRMNTIMQSQIFSPIPFTEYHPDIVYPDDVQRPLEVDINRNYGGYDIHNFETISFYIKDYQTVRKSSEKDISIVRNDKDIISILKLSKSNIIDSLFELFVVYSDLHTLRAVEPALKVRYSEIDCRGARLASESSKISCENRKYSRLGHRGQLAKLILDYQNSN